MSNPIHKARELGQSIWLDNISRSLITRGGLYRLMTQDGISGVTSNPAIFKNAIAGSVDYEPASKALVAGGARNAKEIFEQLAIADIQLAADVLYPVYLSTKGADGFVSMEVSPHLAHDTKGTVEEGRRLRAAIARDNVMIKVPATPAGLAAITQLIGDGININVTLLFSVEVYQQVALAYLEGLENLAAAGGEPGKVASVASFFVSRIDSVIDKDLLERAAAASDAKTKADLEALVGKTAIANARVAYARFQELCDSDRWKAVAAKGAQPQRLLWASTSTKNPDYPKSLYVEELIGPDTVNTIPDATLDAFRAEGRVRQSITEDPEGAAEILRQVAAAGISLTAATDYLLVDGVKKFADAFDELLAAVEERRRTLEDSLAVAAQ